MKLGKSKLALANVINESGGWPERALWAVQDNCIAFFLGGKPEYKSGDRCWHSNSIDGACVGTITCDEKVTNWHQTCISREEYYHAYPKADADEWIEWKGGECPVEKGLMVDIRVRNGREERNLAANTLTKGRIPDASYAFWENDGMAGDIIAYRPHKPEVKPELCESVMRSIPEPESIDGLCAKVTEENKHQHVDAKPTIEQLAQDYRNKLDFAKRKQQEADDAMVAADVALGELERAGEALGLLIGIAKPDREPELVITDWRDLQENDVIFVGEYDGYESGEYAVVWLEDSDYDGDYAVMVVGIDGIERCMDTAMEWRFIRRP